MSSQFTLSALESLWVAVASLSLVGYDYFLTLDREIKYVWRRKLTSASAIYVILRYCSLAAIIVTLLIFFPWPGKSSPKCNAIARLDSTLDAVIILSSAVFSALRAYALSHRKTVATLVFALGLVNSIPSFYGAIKTGASYNPGPHNTNTICRMDFSSLVPLRNVIIAGRSCGVAADLIVLTLTWRRAWPWQAGGAAPKFSLSKVLFNDGVAYFFALLMANVVNLAFINDVQLVFTLVGWISTTTVLFTCRFILDLHEAARALSVGAGLGGESVRFSTVPDVIPSMEFRRSGSAGGVHGVYDASVSWDGVWSGSEDASESLRTYDYDFELQESPRDERGFGRGKSDVDHVLGELGHEC